MKFAIVLALLAATPFALALAVPAENVHVLTQTSSRVDIEVHYADGLGSTRFAFVQLAGPTGSSIGRLKPTPECTEWIGTFTEAAVFAGSDDAVASRLLRFLGEDTAAGMAPADIYTAPLDLEVASSVGGMSGRILVCDRAGDGLVHLVMSPVSTQSPIVARVSLEASP